MHGNIQGALVALTVYLAFQLCGMLCAFAALRNKHFGLRLLVGSVLGTGCHCFVFLYVQRDTYRGARGCCQVYDFF